MTDSSRLQTAASLWAQDLLADLSSSGPVHLEPDERLWKVYIFRPSTGRATHLEHRIYSKLKPGGHLALVTFAAHRPNGGPPVRSGVARVLDLSREDLGHIIDSIRRQTNAAEDEYHEVDLSHLATWPDQLEYLSQF
jgi:hypothetical protein